MYAGVAPGSQNENPVLPVKRKDTTQMSTIGDDLDGYHDKSDSRQNGVGDCNARINRRIQCSRPLAREERRGV